MGQWQRTTGTQWSNRSHIQEEIRREIVAQVKEQVNLQIREHLPVTLEEQARESKGQLIEVKHALMNSYVTARIPAASHS